MENTVRKLSVYARSNLGTFIVVSVSVDSLECDLKEYIYSLLSKIQSYNNKLERFKVEHIEISNLISHGKSKENNFEVYP